jgi:glucose dehydrogenase
VGWISYDADLDLVYYGTSNPGPGTPSSGRGDNKFTSGLLRATPSTGQARWFYQLSRTNEFDYDAVNESVLVDSRSMENRARSGPTRSQRLCLCDGPLDRASTVRHAVCVGQHVYRRRPRDGFAALRLREAAANGTVVPRHLSRLSGRQGLAALRVFPPHAPLYIPHQNLCQDEEATQTSYIVGTPYVGAIVKIKPDRAVIAGCVTAWDPAAGKSRWVIEEDLPVWSGALVTAATSCSTARWMAGSRRSMPRRPRVWQFKTGSGIVGQPISYRGPDGKQYIAILSGRRGVAGASRSRRPRSTRRKRGRRIGQPDR